MSCCSLSCPELSPSIDSVGPGRTGAPAECPTLSSVLPPAWHLPHCLWSFVWLSVSRKRLLGHQGIPRTSHTAEALPDMRWMEENSGLPWCFLSLLPPQSLIPPPSSTLLPGGLLWRVLSQGEQGLCPGCRWGMGAVRCLAPSATGSGENLLVKAIPTFFVPACSSCRFTLEHMKTMNIIRTFHS